MKKASLLFIAVVCIIAVVFVTFFGQAVSTGQFTNPITSITITDARNGNGFIVTELDPVTGQKEYQLHWTFAPQDATAANDPDGVRYSLINGVTTYEDGHVSAEISNRGVITFYEPGAVTARITATDGYGASDTVDIICIAAS